MARISLRVQGYLYAVEARDVLEVVPRLVLRPVSMAPPGVAGLFDYRGSITPVVDLTLLITKEPCPDRLGTRIIVIKLGQTPVSQRLLGLLAEEVIDILPDIPIQPGMRIEGAPFFGGVFAHGEVLVQLIDPSLFLTNELWDALLLEAS